MEWTVLVIARRGGYKWYKAMEDTAKRTAFS